VVTAIFSVIAGVSLTIPGIILAGLGGSSYYTLAGIALVVSVTLLWKRQTLGLLLYAAIVVVTFVWALWEVGPYGWGLLPRLSLFVPLTAILAVGLLRQPAGTNGRPLMRPRTLVIAVGAIAITGSAVYVWRGLDTGTSAVSYAMPTAADSQWPVTGGDRGSRRYSPLEQITPENVSKLKLASKVHLGVLAPGRIGALQATPLMINDLLYMCNMENVVSARDIETGELLWQFDPKIDHSKAPSDVCRGIAYQHDSSERPLRAAVRPRGLVTCLCLAASLRRIRCAQP
jgi:quinoprotein glucose dehydrogenase